MDILGRLVDFFEKEYEELLIADGTVSHHGLTCHVCNHQIVGGKLCHRCLMIVKNSLMTIEALTSGRRPY